MAICQRLVSWKTQITFVSDGDDQMLLHGLGEQWKRLIATWKQIK